MTDKITTDTPDATPDTEVKNPAALLAKNRALLSELAQLKAELESARTALDSEKQRGDTLGADLHDLRVVRPWQATLRDIAGTNAGMLARALTDYINVVAGPDGGPELQDKQGQPLLLKDRQAVTPENLRDWIHEHGEKGDFDDLRPMLIRARGMGATGATSPRYTPAQAVPDSKPATPHPYGLR